MKLNVNLTTDSTEELKRAVAFIQETIALRASGAIPTPSANVAQVASAPVAHAPAQQQPSSAPSYSQQASPSAGMFAQRPSAPTMSAAPAMSGVPGASQAQSSGYLARMVAANNPDEKKKTVSDMESFGMLNMLQGKRK